MVDYKKLEAVLDFRSFRGHALSLLAGCNHTQQETYGQVPTTDSPSHQLQPATSDPRSGVMCIQHAFEVSLRKHTHAIFHGCKNDNFQLNFFLLFS